MSTPSSGRRPRSVGLLLTPLVWDGEKAVETTDRRIQLCAAAQWAISQWHWMGRVINPWDHIQAEAGQADHEVVMEGLIEQASHLLMTPDMIFSPYFQRYLHLAKPRTGVVHLGRREMFQWERLWEAEKGQAHQS